jgi:lipid-binding SYLF domain-containing protein
MKTNLITILGGLIAALLFNSCASGPGGTTGMSVDASASKIRNESTSALNQLYAANPKARQLGQSAKGVLVFPSVTKGGLIAGGAYGRGTLFQNGRVAGYYQAAAASWGLQAGLQKYSSALMLMDNDAINSLNRSGGWSIGSAPHLVVVDKGISKSLSTDSLRKGTYAFIYGQKGLMGGLGLEGVKLSRIYPQKP